MRCNCPHCAKKAVIRTSRPISELTREYSMQCTNIMCGHTWVAVLSAIRTIVPSATPNPSVHIPRSEKQQDSTPAPSPTG
ncbi:MAG: ogr/Delta-like zinc finger family protein [Nitrosomonadales bacterium]|nr:ogr/Delta-like zinc finger family protein [Nitrosomonadales bacterium]